MTHPVSETPKVLVERVQSGVRIEKRMLKVLKALAEYFDLSLGDLLEGIVLHTFEGKCAFSADQLQRIQTLKEIYGMDYDARASHRLVEEIVNQDQDEHALPFKPYQVSVISLWAEDVPAITHFYQDVVRLDLLPHHGERPHFKLGDTHLAILKGRPVPAQDSEPPNFPVVAFAVQDLDAAVERLQAHAVEIPWGIKEGAESRWVMFHDPAGNLIELAQFKQAVGH
jgi:predicted enzyme related to lactoylglutathione lyase